MGPHRRSSHDSVFENANKANNTSTDDFEVDFDILNGPWPCGVPKGHVCLYANGGNSEHIAITQDDLKGSEAVKILCSNDQCPRSPFLHSACFTAFEETILVYLKSQGRARGWSDKQRVQNLWTKRGYDLVYKACECSCCHGYVRKDLDWNPVADQKDEEGEIVGGGDLEGHNANEEIYGAKRKRKKSKSQSKGPTVCTIGLPNFGHHDGTIQGNHEQQQHQAMNVNISNNNTTIGLQSSSFPPAQNQDGKDGNVPFSSCNTVHTTLSATTSNPTYYQVNSVKIIATLQVSFTLRIRLVIFCIITNVSYFRAPSKYWILAV